MYKLSIIIPTFNLENYIKLAFDSIKSQTIGFENIEVIFVDDNSTDNTFKIITDYSNNYRNVKVFKTDENSGFAGKPRNIGLEKSTAEYVLFLDGDDQLLVDSCEVLLNNECDIAIGSHINCYDNGVLEHIPALQIGRTEVFETINDPNLLNMTPAISAKLFKKELLVKNDIKFVEGIPAQDLIFLLESLLNSKKITVMNYQYIYFRNIHKNSVSYKITEKYLLGLIKSYTLIADLFEKYSINYKHQKVIFKKHIGFFTAQILRACNLNSLTLEELNRILNSDSFKNLAKKAIFKNNSEFSEYFKYMFDSKYEDAKTAINNIKIDSEIDNSYLNMKDKNSDLKNQNTILTEQNNKVNNQNIDLKNQNTILTEQNNKVNKQNSDLKNQNTILTEQNNKVNKKLVELKKDVDNIYLKNKELVESNESLKSENSNLKTELQEIKSKRLWKLINKF